jgi:hypothetical protein
MTTTLVVPGLDGGAAGHWLSWLEGVLADTRRVGQNDLSSLELSQWASAVSAELEQCREPVTIVAHGFGCLAALCASISHPGRIESALLVAPFDPDALRLAWMLPEEPLSFPAVIAASSNDPYLRSSKAAFWANYWSCDLIDLGRSGSVDPASGFGAWPAVLEILDDVRNSPRTRLPHLVTREAERLSRAI